MEPIRLQILHVLTDIAANGPKQESWGICTHVSAGLCDSAASTKLFDLFKSWPEYSGCLGFPVEGGATAYMRNPDRWGVSTEYGAKRYRLLAFLIHELSKESHADQRTA